jgi:glycine/D-amino acid oxidase-like deaminating enzyme
MIVKYDVIIVGAGIVGLSLARASAIKGLKVAVFEKNEFAVGASIRNFGLIWPIGQPKGKLLNRAIRSTEIWAEIAKESNLPIYNNGSLHLATNEIEKRAFEEFYEIKIMVMILS